MVYVKLAALVTALFFFLFAFSFFVWALAMSRGGRALPGASEGERPLGRQPWG